MTAPTPDVHTDATEALLRELLRDQHPDLAELPLHEVAGGWGNQMWRLGGELALRVQRMDTSPAPQLKERHWLPRLAPQLPLPIPVPLRDGAPSDRFPKLWTVVTWIDGTPLDHGGITRTDHAADTLADFLLALHREAPTDAPPGEGGFGAHPADCAPAFEHFLREAAPPADLTDPIRAVWADAVAAPAWDRPPVWVHGDLHPANVLVTDGTLTGIVDFGALFAGDPASDLAAAWLLLPADGATRCLARYAGCAPYDLADSATVRRARGLAVLKSLFLLSMGRAGDRGLPGGKPHWGPIGLAALDRVLRWR
ncbi:aminoglycoside phosphotransferase family protein [Kitasatospora sp. NPDC096147]|uniref:aminoglycoside phosphotransferase family protein n=1 Tax=Kitasatospora sp. NPDC096147 TaxID=3364093 RepID=UPI00380FB374